jgi:hypothetical protein
MNMRHYTSRSGAVLSVLGLLIFAPAAAEAQRAEGSFQRTLNVSGGADIDVTTGSGQIDVRQGGSGRVEVSARIRADERWGWQRSQLSPEERVRRLETNPPIEQTGSTVRIGYIKDEDLREGVSISYVVTVPPGTSVRARSGSGSQEIDADGPIDVHTGSGSVRVRRAGRLRASAGSGSITAENVGGEFYATTGSGSIRAMSVAGAITAKTGSGGIDITQTAAGDVDVSSSSGTVRVRGVRGGVQASTSSGGLHIQGELERDWRLSASSGHVTIDLPPTQRFNLDATSSSGGIDVDFPISISGRIDRRSVRGAVDGGGPLLRVRTSSGGISIQ